MKWRQACASRSVISWGDDDGDEDDDDDDGDDRGDVAKGCRQFVASCMA